MTALDDLLAAEDRVAVPRADLDELVTLLARVGDELPVDGSGGDVLTWAGRMAYWSNRGRTRPGEVASIPSIPMCTLHRVRASLGGWVAVPALGCRWCGSWTHAPAEAREAG